MTFMSRFWDSFTKVFNEFGVSCYCNEHSWIPPEGPLDNIMTTTLQVRNDSVATVTVYITLGATPGCVQDVSSITGVSITKLQPLMGHFDLPSGATVTLAAPAGMGFNGNFSFNTPPMNCPTPDFPNGVNLGEFIINNGFQPYGQETIDVSCVAGANCIMQFEMDTSDWTSNSGKIKVTTITNGFKTDNTGRVGVFPYGCDNCTSSDNPPECVGKQPQYANKEPICNVQRPAGTNLGGTLIMVYKGPI
jgi:hypothetical protein